MLHFLIPDAKVPDTSNFFTRILSVALAKVTVKPEPIVIEESSDGMTPLAQVNGSSKAPDWTATKIDDDGLAVVVVLSPDILVVMPPDMAVDEEVSSAGAERDSSVIN